MGFGRRLLVLLLLVFLLVSSSTGVPASRSLKSVKNKHDLLVPMSSQYQAWIKDLGNSHGFLKMEGLMERRMSIELADYPDPGANNNHDPNPPGRV